MPGSMEGMPLVVFFTFLKVTISLKNILSHILHEDSEAWRLGIYLFIHPTNEHTKYCASH